MELKKDIQQRIVERPLLKEKASEEELFAVLRSIAPGTHIRAGLNGILRARKGALIAVDSEWLFGIVDGGFRVSSRFTPQRLVELSKMDGAIILSRDLKRILFANALLTPDSRIQSPETGTRHKAAERAAKQAGTLVIAISERRNEMTVYYKNIKHSLVDSGELLRSTNEHIQMLEKQRELFDRALQKLNYLELRNYQSFDRAISVIQKSRIIEKISSGLRRQIIELGKEGTLIKTRLREITSDVEKESDLVVKDYTKLNFKKSKEILTGLSYDELLNKEEILKALGHESLISLEPVKGWRILSKTTLPESDIALIIREAQSLGKAIHSSRQFYEAIMGVEKAAVLRNEIEDIKLNI